VKRSDIVVGIFLIFACVLVYLEAGTYEDQGVQQTFFGPQFFPQILTVLLIGCCGLLIFHAYRGKALRKAESINPQGFVRLIVSIVIAIVYWVSVDFFGFALATPFFLFVLMTQLGARGWKARLGVSVITPIFIWWIFNEILVVSLPEGELMYMIFGE
jgi:putative tricarboxylic transport membrane protein